MDKVFSVELSNGKGQYCELDMPASSYELLDALERLKMEPGELPRWEICTYYDYAYLAPHLDENNTIYEINALSRVLSGSDWHRYTALKGQISMDVRKREEPVSIGRIIDLASNTDKCEVLPDVYDDAQLGRFYAENGFEPRLDKLPDAVFELLDFERIGRNARLNESGEHTDGGYVARIGEVEPVYGSMQLVPRKPEYVFRLVMSRCPFDGEEHKQLDVPLELPASQRELEEVLRRLDVPSWDEVVFRVEDSAVPGLLSDVDLSGGIRRINDLAAAIRTADNAGQLQKLKAVLMAVGCTDPELAMQLIDRLDEYNFVPELMRPDEIARSELRVIADPGSVELLLQHIDLYHYGLDLIDYYNSELTPYGLVERKDSQSLTMFTPPCGIQGMTMY